MHKYIPDDLYSYKFNKKFPFNDILTLNISGFYMFL